MTAKKTTKKTQHALDVRDVAARFAGRRFAAVDPGANSGVAIFTARAELEAVMQGPLAEAVEFLRQHNVPCIVEKPFVYPNDPASPNTLITLAMRAGMFLGVSAPGWLEVFPREWKGGADKAVIHRRAIALLHPGEREYLRGFATTLRARAKDDDVQDAIALGLFACGRADYLRPNR